MGVFISQSTGIVVRATGEVFYGEVGEFGGRCGFHAGQEPCRTAGGSGPHCAVIVKRRQRTFETSINELLN
jgi:2,3,4,5-tetrahydropyridine-2-carboxylate N-succinyltransferase